MALPRRLPKDNVMTAQHRLLALALSACLSVSALLGSPPAFAQSDPAGQAWVQQQFAAYDAGSAMPPSGAPSATAQSLATWDWLRRTPRVGAEPSLVAQAAFLNAHPGWPGVTAIRRRAEAQAAKPETPDFQARSFLTSVPPQTSAGQARLALLSTGAEAAALAKSAWGRTGLSPELEAALFARFGAGFTREDHAKRADQLVWAGQTSAAARLLPMLDDDGRALVQARIALRGGAPDAEALAAALPARSQRNAGLVHDRVLFLERGGRLPEAEALLAAGNTDAGVSAPETWLEKRLAMGRAAMRRGDHVTAQRILANHKVVAPATNAATLPLSLRIDLSDTEWLAGWIALRKLNRPEQAIQHFASFSRAVTTPISQSRGDYWLGRAEKARGGTQAAALAFERAAKHFDYFYGQLAAEELGRLPALPFVPRNVATDADRAKLEGTSLARALVLLNESGARERESMFVRALADAATTPAEARAAAELGRKLRRDDLGMWSWKAARPKGDFSTFDLAFPRLPGNAVPAKDWIISHAIARQESSFDRTALSGAGARGLMQLMPATAQDVAVKLGLPYSTQRLFDDPAYNLTLGSWYIGLRRDNFSNAAMAIAAYNAGAGNVRKWLTLNGDPRGRGTAEMIDWVEMIPIQETRNYVHRVAENAVVYSLLEPSRQGADARASRWLTGG